METLEGKSIETGCRLVDGSCQGSAVNGHGGSFWRVGNVSELNCVDSCTTW